MQGGFFSQPLLRRKFWVSHVALGKGGPLGHSSSCLPAQFSAVPPGQGWRTFWMLTLLSLESYQKT